ncbi:tripartite tricarboxylate transporter TctB family protein [Nissabacter sp. SGAir0207]|uniref:tripartite tricarboxylate transporter TctB family protein n=1 Tax=Nissabacter sp. SGAir0207 TaxID=2126321 RepID=UPI00143D37C6|nr:tripartite tricarboxylate transporter TctB family protein [Nissabacter sp. SGAir0207]
MALSRAAGRRPAEILCAVLWLLIAAYVWQTAASFNPTSASFPRALALLLGLFGLVQLARQFIGGTAAEEGAAPLFARPWRLAFSFLLVFGYLLLMNTIGYIAASLLFGLLVPALAGFGRWRFSLAVVVGTLVFIVLVFHVLLQRPLPAGLIEHWLEAWF